MFKLWLFTIALVIFYTITTATRVEEDELDPDIPEVSYDDYKLLRVYCNQQEELDFLLDFISNTDGIELWTTHNNTAADILSAPEGWPMFKVYLDENNIKYEVLIENLQEAIRNSNPLLEPEDEFWENRSGHRLTWRRYHRYKDIESYLDYLANTYPDICQVQVIGHSSEGRPLKLLKVSSGGPPKPAIWIDGGMHAREWISPATVTYLLLQLVEFREEHRSILDSFDWYVLPVANPDGYEYSHTTDRLWRKTRSKNHPGGCVGVDPNRNFDFHWLEVGASDNSCQENYAGPKPFSEPETQSVANFLREHSANIKIYLTFHSYSQLWLVPWGYTAQKPADYYDIYILAEKAVEALKKARGTDYLLGTADELVYISSGSSDDWAKGVAGIKYSYTIELPDTGHHGFVLPASRIEPTGQETWEGIRTLVQHYITDVARG